MKKMLTLFLAAMFLSGMLMVGKAHAILMSGWTLDTSSLDGGQLYENIEVISVSGSSLLEQTLTGAGPDVSLFDDDNNVIGSFPTFTMVDGDPFIERTFLRQLITIDSDGFDTNMSNIYIYAEDVEGVVTSVNNDGGSPNPADWTFEYEFTSIGSMGIYYSQEQYSLNLPNLFAPGNSDVTQLASFSFITGDGTAPKNFLGDTGGGFTGSTSLVTRFENVTPGIFRDPNGVDFTDLITDNLNPLAFLSLDNTIARNTFEYELGDNFFTTRIGHDGSYILHAVPEPSTILLLGAGLLGLAAFGRRKFNKNS